MAAGSFAVDCEARHKPGSGCRVVAGIEEVSSIQKLMHVLASWLATMRFETKSTYHGHVTSKALRNIVGNIEGIIVAEEGVATLSRQIQDLKYLTI